MYEKCEYLIPRVLCSPESIRLPNNQVDEITRSPDISQALSLASRCQPKGDLSEETMGAGMGTWAQKHGFQLARLVKLHLLRNLHSPSPLAPGHKASLSVMPLFQWLPLCLQSRQQEEEK